MFLFISPVSLWMSERPLLIIFSKDALLPTLLSNQVVLKPLSTNQSPLASLLKTQIAGAHAKVFDSAGPGRGVRSCVLTNSWVMLLLLVWAPLLEKQDYFLSKHNIIFSLFTDFLSVPYMTENSRWGGTMMPLFSVLPTVPRAVPALWWKSLSRVWLFETPWTIQSMEFSRPQYWSG